MIIDQQTIKSLVKATNGTLISSGKVSEITDISFDSRSHSMSDKTLFVALRSKKNDGHKYLKEAYNKGCRTFLVAQELDLEDANIILVENTLKALQKLAKAHREKFSYPVIGITGSFGKTTVKEWLYDLLKDDFDIVRSPKSYNSQIGVPVSLLRMQNAQNLALIEAGISHPGEMKLLHDMIQPTHGIFTGLGSAHSENFDLEEQHRKEKMCLFKGSKMLASADELKLEILEHHADKSTININKTHTIEVPFTDRASIQNAALVFWAAKELGVDEQKLKSMLKQLKSLALRMELLEGKNESIIINDSYNSDENGLEIALDFLEQKAKNKVKIVVSSFYNDKAAVLKNTYNIAEWIVISKTKPKQEVKHYSSVSAFLQNVPAFENAAILIKGTMKDGFHQLSRHVQKTNHATGLSINLNAISNNINVFRQFLNPKTKLMVMVKAFGYGSGSIELAKHLESEGVDMLGVAYANEGEALRKADIKLPIMVMSPEQSAFDNIIEHQLEPEIYSLDVLDDFIRALINHDKKEYPIHLKIDSGMHRQGFKENELTAACETINTQPEVAVASVFSHLAASDEVQEKAFTLKQIKNFEQSAQKVEKLLGKRLPKHILNSHGILNFPEHQHDMVRLGIGLFGIDATKKIKQELQNVVSFTTSITQIKHVKKGASVGYGRETILTEDKTIGILPVGYADGYFRALSNKAEVYINGKRAKVIGNICMDMTIIDLTDVSAKESDKVELFGEHITIEEVAKKANTIPYEILTSMSGRLKRVYLKE